METAAQSAAKEAAVSARVAVAAIFLMHGVVTGGWAPHVPLAKAKLAVGTGLFGWILLAMAAGGVIAMPVTGALIHRFGSATVEFRVRCANSFNAASRSRSRATACLPVSRSGSKAPSSIRPDATCARRGSK